MLFSSFATILTHLESAPRRLDKTQILADLFKTLTPPETQEVCYLLQGRVTPHYLGSELGIAEKLIIKACVRALQLDPSYFQKKYEELGDVGTTVAFFKGEYVSFEETPLTISQVYQKLLTLSLLTGPGSQEGKVGIIEELVRMLDAASAKFLVRIAMATIRLGFSDRTVLDALSWMITGDKTHSASLLQAFQIRPDLGALAAVMRERGIEAVACITPELGVPILMMRAQRLSSGSEIVSQIGECAIEPKFDGLRMQIHINTAHAEVKIFTRGLEIVTDSYRDIVASVLREISATTAIIECEAVGYSVAEKKLLPFQETITRKRKHNLEEAMTAVPLKCFTFDLLYCNGESLIHEPYLVRRAKLAKLLTHADVTQSQDILTTAFATPCTCVLSPIIKTDNASTIESLFDLYTGAGLEGIMAKKLDCPYMPGAREWGWIKLKKSYNSKLNDTIDCLVMGYDQGRGKRAGFGIGAILVGVYDEATDTFVTVAKIGTGMTDTEWRALHAHAQTLLAPLVPEQYKISPDMQADVWITPAIVLQIKSDEITPSTLHSSGYSLRFPRMEAIRADKSPREVTTMREIEGMRGHATS